MKKAEEVRPANGSGGLFGDVLEIVARWLTAVVSSVWELSAALVAVGAFGVFVGVPPLALVGVAVLIPVALVVLALAGWPPAGDWWRVVQGRYQRVRLRQRWPEIATQLGWDHAFGDRRRRVPDLVRVRRTGTSLIIELRPLPQQRRESWGVLCDQLRRYVGAAVARYDEPRPGVLAIYLGMLPLPTTAEFPRAVRTQAWDVLRLGVRAGGDEVSWRPSDVPHLLVGGVTKGGKGSAIRSVAYDGLASGWQLLVVNPKLSGEYGWLERLGVPVLERLESIQEVIEGIEVERERRQAIVKRAAVGSWDRVSGWTAPPLMLIVDEVSALLMVDKANKEIARTQERLSYLITRLVQLGRSAGIHLVLATQRPDVSTLGPNGGILRDNIDGRIGVCSLQDEGVRMLFGGSIDPDIKGVLNGTKGRALATMLSAGDFDVYGMQLYYLDEADLLTEAITPVVAQGVRLPMVSPGAA